MKKQLLTLSLILLSATFIAQDLSNGLLLHYDFNGNANDISGNDMHGTVNGATLTSDKDGNSNSAYFFDGVDDYVEFANDNSLKPQFPLTISCTVRFDDLSVVENRNGAINTDYSSGVYTGVTLGVSNGVLSLSYGDGGTPGTANRVSGRGSTLIQENQWYNVVGVIYGNSDMDIYVDCVKEVVSYDGTGGDIVYSGNSGRLGVIYGAYNYFFKGAIGEIRYWNRSLTQEEVELLCDNTLDVEEKIEENLVTSVYPNPSSNDILISFTNNQSKSIELLDLAGKLIGKWNAFDKTELKIKDLDSGMYFLKVFNGVSQTTQRLVISK